jgi:hypothetical protein
MYGVTSNCSGSSANIECCRRFGGSVSKILPKIAWISCERWLVWALDVSFDELKKLGAQTHS